MNELKQQIELRIALTEDIKAKHGTVSGIEFDIMDADFSEMQELSKEMDSRITFSEPYKRMSMIVYDVMKGYTIHIKSRQCSVDISPKF